ncbi:hypothetical protein Hanom_Chr07g00620741 [Helianthus anomalus]
MRHRKAPPANRLCLPSPFLPLSVLIHSQRHPLNLSQCVVFFFFLEEDYYGLGVVEVNRRKRKR